MEEETDDFHLKKPEHEWIYFLMYVQVVYFSNIPKSVITISWSGSMAVRSHIRTVYVRNNWTIKKLESGPCKYCGLLSHTHSRGCKELFLHDILDNTTHFVITSKTSPADKLLLSLTSSLIITAISLRFNPQPPPDPPAGRAQRPGKQHHLQSGRKNSNNKWHTNRFKIVTLGYNNHHHHHHHHHYQQQPQRALRDELFSTPYCPLVDFINSTCGCNTLSWYTIIEFIIHNIYIITICVKK